MKTKSLLAIVLCAVFSSLAFCEPKSEPILTKSRNFSWSDGARRYFGHQGSKRVSSQI
ncbi:hypothetical protein VB002_08435 [Campylobacter concisus]